MQSHNDTKTENTTAGELWFADWLRRGWPRVHDLIFSDKWEKILSVLIALGVLTLVAQFVRAVIKENKTFLFYVNDVGHLILLTASLAFFLRKLEDGKPVIPYDPHDPTAIAVKQFNHWLYGIVVFWIAFYVVRFFADLPLGPTGEASASNNLHWAQVLPPYINAMSAIPLFGLYVVLAKRSVHEFFWGMGNRMWIAIFVILIVFAFQVGADIKNSTDPQTNLKLVAGIVNGIVVGGALALVVGRLDSRYIGLPNVIVAFLYLYALIQPLYPIVFKENGSELMYPFVGLALIMKCTLILTLGMIIDNRRLHFYVTNLRWLDANAATMITQYDAALHKYGVSKPMPPLFCFVHPKSKQAVLRFETLDIQINLAILNAWRGVGWELKDFEVESVGVSSIDIPVKDMHLPNRASLTVKSGQSPTFASLYINLAIQQSDLFNRLRHDNRIMDAIGRKQRTKRVDIVLKGIKAKVAILEEGSLQHISTPIEAVDGNDSLFFECIIELEKIPSA